MSFVQTSRLLCNVILKISHCNVYKIPRIQLEIVIANHGFVSQSLSLRFLIFSVIIDTLACFDVQNLWSCITNI